METAAATTLEGKLSIYSKATMSFSMSLVKKNLKQ
jgi:hypothetical protein